MGQLLAEGARTSPNNLSVRVAHHGQPPQCLQIGSKLSSSPIITIDLPDMYSKERLDTGCGGNIACSP